MRHYPKPSGSTHPQEQQPCEIYTARQAWRNSTIHLSSVSHLYRRPSAGAWRWRPSRSKNSATGCSSRGSRPNGVRSSPPLAQTHTYDGAAPSLSHETSRCDSPLLKLRRAFRTAPAASRSMPQLLPVGSCDYPPGDRTEGLPRARPRMSGANPTSGAVASNVITVRCRPRAWILLPPSTARLAKVAFLRGRGRDPADCRWPVRDKAVLVLACGEGHPAVDVLLIELLRAGARVVHARHSNGTVITYDPTARMRRQAV